MSEVVSHFTIQDDGGWYHKLAHNGLLFVERTINGSSFECNDVDSTETQDTSKFGQWKKKKLPDGKYLVVPQHVYKNDTLFLILEPHGLYACFPKPSKDGCPDSCFRNHTDKLAHNRGRLQSLSLRHRCHNDTRCIPTSAHMDNSEEKGRLSFGGKCLSATSNHGVKATECDGSSMQRWAFKTWVRKNDSKPVI